MAGDKRTKAQKLKDRQKIARLRLFGKTQQQIAQDLGLSQPTVARDLKVIEAEWQESAKADIDSIKTRELAKLDFMEAEVIAEWEQSKKDYQKKVVEEQPGTKKTAEGGTIASRKAKIESGGQTGDPRYMTVLLGIQDRRAKLLGTDKPLKVSPTDPDGNELPPGPVIVALPAQLGAEAWALAFSKPAT